MNGTFDTDTLIWKQLEMQGSDLPYFNSEDWRYPGPTVDGHAPLGTVAIAGRGQYRDSAAVTDVVLFDRLHSYVHVVPDYLEDLDPLFAGTQRDTVSATNHRGSGDLFVHQAGSSSAIEVRLVDANGVAVCPYDSGILKASVAGVGPGEEPVTVAETAYSAGAPCRADGTFVLHVRTAPTDPAKRCSANCVASGVSLVLEYTFDTHTGTTENLTLAVPGATYSMH